MLVSQAPINCTKEFKEKKQLTNTSNIGIQSVVLSNVLVSGIHTSYLRTIRHLLKTYGMMHQLTFTIIGFERHIKIFTSRMEPVGNDNTNLLL